ncbi:DUF4440 domain-containing protein [Neisseria zoodegmatis]|uniref:DUF4440 domain-containing protein n=1 Tax=Neisseria zoodegmatis TaxID=326523 RepID=A0A1X3CR98_9NEIS|nr:DUF4440 domain-containing protein [Neisseria zoodegmatis]OSI10112.1 DUF4440 domain-containing protein [Neisseria zoodegmatis]SNU80360.1 Uncharacterized protein conserved in bacteria with a cystatin-like fold [Neisseria zoodegmatis]SUA35615.1 Uncharacterized protein conserved in bacteria with a cystatin-like fold [Neisseria zoodegmatis]
MKMSLLAVLAMSSVLAACAGSGKGKLPSTDTVSCKAVSKQEIAALFDRWNNSLKTGDPKQVVANYAPGSILLPTVSNKPRLTPEEKEDYFTHFLSHKPVGSIDMSHIQIGCNLAMDNGLYTFTYADGTKHSGRYTFTYGWDGNAWLISSHHSSLMPEKPGKSKH